jgi:hypothetical protein
MLNININSVHMSPSGHIVLYSTASLFYIKPRFAERLLQHNILEPTVCDGLLHCTLVISLAIRIPVPWSYFNYYNINIIIDNFILYHIKYA